MAFKHTDYTTQFLAKPGQNGAKAYGVSIELATVARGQAYWRCIGVHKLSGKENHGQSNVFLEALDEHGNRVKNPFPYVGWTWENKRDNEPANPVHLDKPDYEPGGNLNLGFRQTAEVWMVGQNREHPDISDKVIGLHTRHGDPPGDSGNYNGHHSFYVVWQRTVAGQLPPVVEPPVEEPVPTPVHTYTISGPAFSILRADGLPIAQVTTPEWARRIVAALKVLDASDADHSIESYRDALKKWAEGEI